MIPLCVLIFIQYDISVPVRDMYKIVPVLKERVGNKASRIVGYGHFGDGED